jgi:hypothetical protein
MQMSVSNEKDVYNSDLWSYRTDAYFGNKGVNKKIAMSVMYMDSKHSMYFEKPILKFLSKKIAEYSNLVQKNFGY